MPKGLFDPMPHVWVTLENGEEKFIFEYYPDEITFREDEIKGKTIEEAHSLKRAKDYLYLSNSH